MSFDPTPETKSDQCLVGVLMGPSGGGGDDSSRTRSAQDDGADGEPSVESPETRKRKAPSTGGGDK